MVELLEHKEEHRWLLHLDETETVQLYVNGSPYGSVYTVGSGRETLVTLFTEEKNAET